MTGLYLIILFSLLTLTTLVIGLVIMAKGGKVNSKYSNQLMRARVLFQAIAILIIFIMFLFIDKS